MPRKAKCLTLGALQTLLLGGPGGQTNDADTVHVNKRPRLNSANADLGNEDGAVINHEDEEDDEVPVHHSYVL